MDRSSGQGGPQGQSSGTYQINVNRTKTRKWVQAKVQTYDGDDWGAPDEEDEDDEPESPTEPPVAPLQPKVISNRLPSDTRVPGTRRPTFPLSPVNPPPQEVISTPNHPEPPSFGGPPSAGFPALDNTVRSPGPAADVDGPSATRRLSFEAHPSEIEPTPRKDSTSPRLPDVGRMSTFGSDFFPPSDLSDSGKAKVENPPPDNEKDPWTNESVNGPGVVAPNPQRPPLPGNWVTESTSPAMSTPVDSKQHSPQPGDDARALPPLVTSSQNDSHMVPPPLGSQGPEETRHGITPPEPRQPRNVPEGTPSDYEPQPLTKANTLDTHSSSLVKESDVLSDEIMRSLTPGGPPSSVTPPDTHMFSEDTTGPSRTPTAADFGGHSREPEVASPANKHQLQHRFSWEAFGDDPNKPPQPSAAVPDTKVTVTGMETSTVSPPVETTGASSPISEPSIQPISPTIIMVSDSKSPDFLSKTSMDGPSSPDWDTRDGAGPSFPVPTAQSLQKETLSPSPAPTDDDGSSAAPIEPPPKDKPMVPFKDITELATSERRVEKFEETRKDVATTDSGLGSWILMVTRQPDHANATSSMSGSGPLPAATIHLSASSGTAASSQDKGSGGKAAGAARMRLAGLQEQAQAAAGSAFGHSGGQIGHKSKEFMQSAGKMGKGLFSKGRSKLRGTGDKVNN